MITTKILAITLLLIVFAAQGQNTSVSFNGPRSLAAALAHIQTASGIPINYEEPPYENSADLLRTGQQSHPGLRPMIVARTIPSPIVVSLIGLSPTSDAMISVEAVLGAYHKAGLPGTYKAIRRAGGIDVIPSQVVGALGSMKAITSIMGRNVSLPYGERTALDTLQMIIDSVAKASGYQIRLLRTPFYTKDMSNRVALAGSGQSAADELLNLAARAEVGKISYQLMFDPNDRSYYLSLISVSPNHPTETARPPRERQGNATDNPFFIKAKP